MAIRRVVTGLDNTGRSVVVSDDQVEPAVPPLLGGNEITELWGADTTPVLPTDGTKPEWSGYFAPAPGYRFGFFSMPPFTHQPPEVTDFDAALAETERQVPGITAAVTDNEGIHATDTVDLLYIVSGQIELRLDSGERTVLGAGDCVVQNGTKHAWYNPDPEQTCLILVVFIGAHRQA